MFVIWGRPNCQWCERAKELLTSRDMYFSYRELTKHNFAEFDNLFPGQKTVPGIVRFYPAPPDGDYDLSYTVIGGYEDLVKYLK